MSADLQQRLSCALSQLDQSRQATRFRARAFRTTMTAVGILIGVPVFAGTVFMLSEAARIYANSPDVQPAGKCLEVSVIGARNSYGGATVHAEVRSPVRLARYHVSLLARDADGKLLGESRTTGSDLARGDAQEKTWYFRGVDADSIDSYETCLHSAHDSRNSVMGRTFYARLKQ